MIIFPPLCYASLRVFSGHCISVVYFGLDPAPTQFRHGVLVILDPGRKYLECTPITLGFPEGLGPWIVPTSPTQGNSQSQPFQESSTNPFVLKLLLRRFYYLSNLETASAICLPEREWWSPTTLAGFRSFRVFSGFTIAGRERGRHPAVRRCQQNWGIASDNLPAPLFAFGTPPPRPVLFLLLNKDIPSRL